jgi:transcriptional regulator GlxA family with amidase domain
MTPNEFIIRTRIQRAQTLLAFSNHGVSQIASLLGYADAFCFSHQFKQRTGVSPTEYRRRKPC